MRKRIVVTQRDISAGKKGSPIGCPIALAALRAGPDAFVGPTSFKLGSGPSCLLPLKAREFVSRFDRGLHVDPFIFHVDIQE